MEPTPQPQISLTMMLVLVACVALNFWLFRLGVFWGLVGLNITKHVVIAALCQALGVNRRLAEQAGESVAAASGVLPKPSSN